MVLDRSVDTRFCLLFAELLMTSIPNLFYSFPGENNQGSEITRALEKLNRVSQRTLTD